MDNTPKKPASFDPARFRISTSLSNDPVVQKVHTVIRVDKPAKQQYVQTRKGEPWRAECAILHLADDERPYIVDPSIAHLVAHDMKLVQLRLGIDRQGNVFLWPVPLVPAEGVENPWNQSHRQIADLSENRWVRMISNTAIGAYEAFEAGGEIPDPTWPELTFAEILEIAFGHGHVIDDRDHPAIRKLRGEL